MGETFHYEHRFKASMEEVFNQIVSWLKNEGAMIIKEKAPVEAEAVHGSLKALAVWKKTAEKRMSFALSEDSEGVKVSLVMEPASKMYDDDVYVWRNKIQTSWGQLANDIWTSIERSEIK
jgi:hypothetical protein